MRFGLVGLGEMGRHHARILGDCDDVKFVGAVDPAGDKFRSVRQAEIFSDLDSLLAQDIEAAVVAVPTAYHEQVAIRLAGAGVAALIEKPLAGSVAEGKAIQRAFQEAQVVAAVGHVERFNSALQELKKRMDAGEIGRIISISTERVGPFPIRVRDVGVVKDLATHDIDIVGWLGGAHFAEVSSQLAHRMDRPQEDLVVATGRLANGIVVSLNVNWLTPTKRRQVVVLGERGAFVADLITSDLYFYANGEVEESWDHRARLRGVSEGNMIRYAFAKREPLAVEHEAFRRHLKGGPTGELVSLQDGVEILSVAERLLGPNV